MSSLKSDAVLSKSKGRQKPDRIFENQEVQAIGGKDVSLFLFRALGKILYCKRKKTLYIFKKSVIIIEIKYIFFNVIYLVQLQERARTRSDTLWQGLRKT